MSAIKFTLDQFKDSKKYGVFRVILDTELDPSKKYTTAEVDKILATYNKRV